MRYIALALMALGGIGWAANEASAQDVGSIRLLDNAVVDNAVSPAVQVTPVRLGWGWRGPGWYPGGYRPYGAYYRPYGNYYGRGYYPGRYYSGYRGPGYYGPWRY